MRMLCTEIGVVPEVQSWGAIQLQGKYLIANFVSECMLQ